MLLVLLSFSKLHKVASLVTNSPPCKINPVFKPLLYISMTLGPIMQFKNRISARRRKEEKNAS